VRDLLASGHRAEVILRLVDMMRLEQLVTAQESVTGRNATTYAGGWCRAT